MVSSTSNRRLDTQGDIRMASVISSGTSPMSGFSQVDDDLESWQFLDADGGGNAAGSLQELAGSLGLDTSPSVVSQGSWGIVGNTAAHQHHQHQHYHQQQQQQQQQQHQQQQQMLLQTPSPGPLMDHALSVSPLNGAASFAHGSPGAAGVGNGAASFGFSGSPLDNQQHVSQSQFVIEALQHGQAFSMGSNTAAMFEQSQIDFDFGLNNFPMLPDTGFSLDDAHSQSLLHFNIPSSMQGVNASPPWTHIPIQQQYSTPVVPDSFDSHSGSSIGHFTPPSGSGSSIDLSPKASPGSLQFRIEGSRSATSKAIPIPTADRKDRAASKVRKTQKRKSSTPPFLSTSSASRVAEAATAQGGGTQGSAGAAQAENPVFLFCNATPDTWAKGGGSFDGTPDASKASQKGRKGALSNDTRANALAVRQRGACFCCHVRKVKCDQQRPCRSCERFCAQVPQAVCWQFDDFTKALFPPFVRTHFGRDEMARFVADNVASFTLNGVEHPDVTVVLSSGPSLRSKLSIKAKFFTPRASTSDVMQHYFHTVGGRAGGGGGGGEDRVELEALRSAPLGLDAEESGASFRAELKRKVEKYVDEIVQEPGWPLQLTAGMARKTDFPCRVLQVAQRYAQQSGSGIVRRALGVYTMQYLMSHHLTMTPQCVESLRHVNPVAASGPWMTARLLNRQVKAVVDGLIVDGVTALFDEFGKMLKRRGKAEWAPCTAAFLVFCLLMESIQASADVFAISEIEIEMRNRRPVKFRRAEALDANRAIEDMPFKQFVFQFHQIYQSHSRDASSKSFNPLVDDSHDRDGQLDAAALELIMSLRSMVHLEYGELSWLIPAPMAPAGESHPYPRNVEEDYIGRLLAKFLLSFLDSRFISED